jgi:hypothetical protein
MENSVSQEDTDLNDQSQPAIRPEGLTLLVNLSTDGEHRRGDVLQGRTDGDLGTADPSWALNFSWEEYATLQCGGKSYKPILSTLENTYGLTQDRNIILVFAPGSANDPDFWSSPVVDLTLNIPHLGTGIQHFKFNRACLDNYVASTR